MEALFWTLVLLSQVLGLAGVILIATWLSEHGGGYDWECRSGIGGYHYLLMTIGMAFLYAEGILSFRVCHRLRLSYVAEKAVHATIQSIVIILIGIGIHAAFVCKDSRPTELAGKDMYSLHSWLGMGTIVLFFGQWIYGIVMTVALRRLDRSWQDRLLPNHAFFGLLVFALSIGSCVTGANEMAIYFVESYKQIVPAGHLANAYGICLVVFAAIVSFVAYRPDFQIPESRRHPEGTTAVPTSEHAAVAAYSISGSSKVTAEKFDHHDHHQHDRLSQEAGAEPHTTYGATEQTSFKELREKDANDEV
ncbi:transmembrane ascorbate-dependent reductase CYB561-like [Diadema antillarum]|uniref:transmembrane ascorbate-dependent reductase CYB561-like n=1 Tax=Diadema antillarum TaxID=105358 RepID=UPI003A870C5B